MRLDHLDVDADPDPVLDPGPQRVAEDLRVLVAAPTLGALHPDGELVEVAGPGEHAQVVRAEPLHGQDLLLDLAGEDVHPAHDHHVVGASGDLLHPAEGGVRRPGQQPGQVTGAVADHRHRLLGQRGEHQLALLAVGQHLHRHRVDHLGQEVVLPDVQPVLGLTRLLAHSGPHHLREPVDVDRPDPAALLDAAPHLVGPRLGPEDAHLEAGRAGVDPLGLHLVEDREEVGRRDHDDPRLEVEDQLHLPLGHPAADRDHRAPEPLGTVVRAQPTGEQPVAVGDVAQVARPATGRPDRAGHHLGPGVEVLRGVADHGRLARRTAGRVHAGDLVARHREHPEGVVGAQVGLGGEREPGQVGERVQVGGRHPGLVEGAAVVRHLAVGRLQRGAQPVQLQRLELGTVQSRDLSSHPPTLAPPPGAPPMTSLMTSSSLDIDVNVMSMWRHGTHALCRPAPPRSHRRCRRRRRRGPGRGRAARAGAGSRHPDDAARGALPGRLGDHRLAGRRCGRRAAQRPRTRVRGHPARAQERTHTTGPPPPPAPPAPDDDNQSRITLRLPESVKVRAEEAANAIGQSLNGWLVDAVRDALDGRRIDLEVGSSRLTVTGDTGRRKQIRGWVT